MVLRSVLGIVLILAFGGGWVFAEPPPAGYVAAVRGDAFAVNAQGLTRTLKVNDPIAVDDILVTEDKGRVKIVFQDDTIVTLGEKSRLKLTEYSWSKEQKQGKFKVTINDGLFRIIGGKLTHASPESFMAKTPAASIGIRGSAYAGSVTGRKLSVYLISGKGIDVSNNKGSVALLQPGVGTTVADAYTAPAAPHHLDAAEMQRIDSGSSIDSQPAAGGSVIGPNATVVNQAKIGNSVNVAAGVNNKAQMGSIKIENSAVKGTIVNQATIKNSANVSSGTGNKALMGTTSIE